MKAIILAAGRGTRLKPLTNKTPKALVEISGKPILQWQIEAYLFSGIKESEIFVVGGYKSEKIKSFLKKYYPKVNLIINNSYKTTNNMYSLYLASKNLIKDDIIVSNGDCIYDFEIVREFVNFGFCNSIACDVGKYNKENMKVYVEGGKIRSISKNISQEEAYGLSVDLYKISSKNIEDFLEVIKTILKEDKQLWAEEALNVFVKKHEMYPFDINKRLWFEIDTLEDLKAAHALFSNYEFLTRHYLPR